MLAEAPATLGTAWRQAAVWVRPVSPGVVPTYARTWARIPSSKTCALLVAGCAGHNVRQVVDPALDTLLLGQCVLVTSRDLRQITVRALSQDGNSHVGLPQNGCLHLEWKLQRIAVFLFCGPTTKPRTASQAWQALRLQACCRLEGQAAWAGSLGTAWSLHVDNSQ